MDNVVEDSRNLFARYYNQEIDFAELRKNVEFMGLNSECNSIFGVMGCSCEKDLEVTLMLHEVENLQLAGKFMEELYPGMVFIMLANQLRNTAVDLNRYFSTDRFTATIANAWRVTLGDKFESVVLAGEKAMENLPFLRDQLEYIKTL